MDILFPRTAIIVGFINVAIWFYFFYKVSVELPAVIGEIPQADLDARVLQNQTFLTVDTMSEIIDPIVLNTRINEVFILAREIYDFHAILRGFFFGDLDFTYMIGIGEFVVFWLVSSCTKPSRFLQFLFFFQVSPFRKSFRILLPLDAEILQDLSGESSFRYRGADHQSLLRQRGPFCHCFLGHFPVLCLCRAFSAGSFAQRLGFHVGISLHAVVHRTDHGDGGQFLGASTGSLLFVVLDLPNSRAAGGNRESNASFFWARYQHVNKT